MATAAERSRAAELTHGLTDLPVRYVVLAALTVIAAWAGVRSAFVD